MRVEQATEAVLGALKELHPGALSVEGNAITIGVADPDRENPAILDAIFRAGGRVQSVNVTGSTLEAAYFGLVRVKKD